MPVFETPEPITVQIDLPLGDAWIAATDRTDTVVQVRPRDASSKADVGAAEQTTVEYSAGQLTVRAPKSWRRFAPVNSPSVDVLIELPTGSHVRAEASWAAFRSEGRLGECRFKTGGPAIRLDQTGPLEVECNHGEVVVERVSGAARVTASSGNVRLGEVDGAVEVKNSSGSCWIGQSAGDVRATTAHGEIAVDRALASVTARSTNGSVRVGEVVRGSVDVQTSHGGVEIGVRRGTAAWLELSSRRGRVHNALEAAEGPAEGDDTVEVRASSNWGDILVRRA
ncbi:DUF4097 family beta strand repeat-containing protein [Phytohabitans sp. ZYX-F-186]|uniref:DUF4097 family beta strand repeat-containing protein n=1 Tax=Phytohabitans maris TaxID=3071409 RepID=A0ABU0ZND2_9ACTN|nr:DUF4097 family beta strand repeat-containing protein [Phytohabitans sp. ZYX-F-186]MDQ7908548.1 DUF4097 family beta strand repeat-containing protein [Phytohabitans sp. ZYX-F-186]